MENVTQAKAPKRLPVVLTQAEVRAVLGQMSGIYGLMAALLYGTGTRLMECVRLRVKDVDFARQEIVVRDGKGARDRITMLPALVVEDLQAHLKLRRSLFNEDRRLGKAAVYLPDALARNNAPSPPPSPRTRGEGVSKEWGRQYVFPSGSFSIDPRSGEERRHHLDEKLLQRAMKKAVAEAGIVKPATRTPCATHSPPTFCRRAMTSVRCRNCWATRMWRRR